MDQALLTSLQEKVKTGTFGTSDLPDFFEFLAWFGNEDEEMQEEVEDWNGRILFDLAGLGPLWLSVQEGVFETGRGELADADATLRLSAADAIRIFTGDLEADDAFQSGALQVAGEMVAALQLETLLEIAMERLAGG